MRPQLAKDLSAWLTKEQTREILQVSLRTLDSFVTEGKLQTAKRPQPGKPPATVYYPGDVEQLRKERQPAAHVLPADSTQLARSVAETAQSGLADRVIVPLSFVEEALQHWQKRPEPPRLFLTIQEASHLSGLTQTYLRRAIANGLLPLFKDGRRLRIRRKDLEGL